METRNETMVSQMLKNKIQVSPAALKCKPQCQKLRDSVDPTFEEAFCHRRCDKNTREVHIVGAVSFLYSEKLRIKTNSTLLDNAKLSVTFQECPLDQFQNHRQIKFRRINGDA